MRKPFGGKAFKKIKDSIQSSENESHLDSCRQMIENSYSILDRDELAILNDYMREAEGKFISPFEEEIHNIQHEKLSA